MKTLQIIILCMAMMVMPVMAQSERNVGPEMEISSITLTYEGNSLHITGANGMKLMVYNLTGTRISVHSIDSNDKVIDLDLQKGCYILKVGKVVRKITVM